MSNGEDIIRNLRLYIVLYYPSNVPLPALAPKSAPIHDHGASASTNILALQESTLGTDVVVIQGHEHIVLFDDDDVLYATNTFVA